MLGTLGRKDVDVKHINAMISKRLVHEVHTSERRSFRGCRRRWSWVFQDFYYPKVTAKPLEFGVAFHNGMEVLYDPDTWKWDRQVVKNMAIGAFKKKCEQQKLKYLSNVDQNYLPEGEVADEYASRIELGVGMLQYYCEKVAPGYDDGWTPVQVEVEFIVPIQNPDNGAYLFCTCSRCRRTQEMYWQEQGLGYKFEVQYEKTHEWIAVVQYGPEGPEQIIEDWRGLVVCLAGRIDLLAEDRFGKLWVVDWKTAARLARGDVSGQDRDEFLELDDQIGSYVMALRRKLGLDVRGFVYVELKKAFPAEPQRNVQIRKGCMYSVNKQQSVDYDTYLACVKKNDTQAYEEGLYDDFLAYLKEAGERFHGRYQIFKTDAELEEIERALFMEAAEMTNPDLMIYPSPGRFSCGFCAFRQPCLEKFRQGDYEYMLDTMYDRRKTHYWVKELSTDKQGGE